VGVVVAVDAGTTGVRAFAVNESGAPVGWAYREFPQYFPAPGWVEHDAHEIRDAVWAVLNELATTLREPVAAIGITDQRETIVAWDRRTGAALHRAIVWQDRRTASRCQELADSGHLDVVRARTGLVLDPYFSATKIDWLLREGGVELNQHLALGTIDSWVLWQLTGGAQHATDPSNASRTSVYDLHTKAWSEELAELFRVPLSALPEVRPSSGRFGLTTSDCPLGAGIPVSGIAGDQQAALFGQACFAPGTAKVTYGTGSFVVMNVGETLGPPPAGLLNTVAWELSDGTFHYALEGAVFATGAAVQWLRDGLGLITNAAEIEELARSVPDNGGAVLVPAFTGLGSPWWDPYARGALLGLSRGVGRGHIARATLEAIAYQVRDVIDAMAAVSGRTVREVRADGGAAANSLLLQMQADQIKAPVLRPAVTETTALGAAYLAGLAEGVWNSTSELAQQWALDQTFAPELDPAFADLSHDVWLRAVKRSAAWADSDGD
jgi:glycerol kinase